jgi:hypothetical protein
VKTICIDQTSGKLAKHSSVLKFYKALSKDILKCEELTRNFTTNIIKFNSKLVVGMIML